MPTGIWNGLGGEVGIAAGKGTDSGQLQTALVKRGVGPAAAEELASGYPTNSIKTMIELFDWYNSKGQPRGAGFLVQSIRKSNTIELPMGFESS